jgi:citrate synthase
MTASPNIPAKGLDGITVASTKLSKVEGDIGRLTYCGYDIKDLALNATFEEIVYLLWHLRLPTQAEMNAFKTQLSENMALPPELCRLMKSLPTQTHPMAALRSIVSLAGMYDPLAEDNSLAANARRP